jgi:serine/threonine-protein kinase
MKNQTTFFLGLAFLLGSTSCIKEHVKPVLTVTVSTFAGGGAGTSSDGVGTSASFHFPTSIAIDLAGNSYVADWGNGKIRKISPKGVVTTFAGSGANGSADGQGTLASFSGLSGIAVDVSGNVYVGDGPRIRKVSPTGLVTTLAGSGKYGSQNGPGATASFFILEGIAVDAAGNVYVADSGNDMIRKISPAGVVTTLAGSLFSGSADGKGSAASFYHPQDVAVDAAGNVYVADTGNNMIRKINREGVVKTLAGSGTIGDSDGKGSAASFNNPTGMGLDAFGNIYVADRRNNKIRKMTPQGEVTTLAGSGENGSQDGPGATASFEGPTDVAVDNFGIIYVVDNSLIRKIVVK